MTFWSERTVVNDETVARAVAVTVTLPSPKTLEKYVGACLVAVTVTLSFAAATLLLAYATLSPGLPFLPYCAEPVEVTADQPFGICDAPASAAASAADWRLRLD